MLVPGITQAEITPHGNRRSRQGTVTIRLSFPATIMSLIYHAHIYFLPEEATAAAALHATLAPLLPEGCWLGRLIHREVGPHTRPMFEIDFAEALLPEVRALLEQHRGSLPVLLHPELPDEVAGHTTAAIWLGEMLPLKIDTLSRH